MRLRTVAFFAAGYVAGTRAGHERYGQIVDGMAKASQRLEELSSRRAANGQEPGPRRAVGGS